MFLMIDTRYPSHTSGYHYHTTHVPQPHTTAPTVTSNSLSSRPSGAPSQDYTTVYTQASLSFDIDANFSAYLDFMVKSLTKYHTITEYHPCVQHFQGLLLPSSSDMTKLINIKQVPKHEFSDLMKSKFLCQTQNSSFQNFLCDGIVKVSSFLKNNPTKVENILVIYIFESQLIGSQSRDESEFNSSILKFSRCIEKLCPMYKLRVRLICVKMTSSSLPGENKMIQNIRVLLNPVKDFLFIDTIDNSQFYYEYNFKEHVRYNTQRLFADIELPSLDDTRATLKVEMLGTTLPACDLMRTIYCEDERVRFTLLCTVPRSGLYPVCILGNPIIIGPAQSLPSSVSADEKNNAILFYSLAKHLTEVNTIIVLQSFKKPGMKVPPYERLFWALVPPGRSECHIPFEYHVESMVLVQLCDQDSFLICSNPSVQISTKPTDPSELQSQLQEENDRETEMKEYVETSTQLLESMDIYNPLAFVSLKYQPPDSQPSLSLTNPQYSRVETQKRAEPRTGTKSNNILVTSSTPSKRGPPPSNSTSKFHAKRVKTRTETASGTSQQREDIDEFEY